MSDLELLQSYARENSQSAFATVVDRHLNLVYSAALRQVRSAPLAEEVTQTVFLDLAREAGRLPSTQPLAAWLFVVTRRAAIDVVRRESRRQVREQTAAELAAMKTPSPTWSQIKDVVDEALEQLPESERSALLLRFFEDRSLREVGHSLGVSEDTAQKRVSRALDRLRDLLLRRGVAVSAAGLAADLSAHAIETAPATLSASIGSAVATSGVAYAAAAKATHATAATLAQKSVALAATAAVLGVVTYETLVLFQQRAALAAAPARIEQLRASLRDLGVEQRATAAKLEAARAARAQGDHTAPVTDPEVERAITAWLQRLSQLRELAAQPENAIPELAALVENDWFAIAREASFDNEDRKRSSLRKLHDTARQALCRNLGRALVSHADTHDGRLPASLSEITALLVPKVPAAALEHYTLLHSGLLQEVPPSEWLVAERLEIARAHDRQFFATRQSAGSEDLATVSDRSLRLALRAYGSANAGRLPATPAELTPFFAEPPSSAALAAFLAQPAADFSPEALRKVIDAK